MEDRRSGPSQEETVTVPMAWKVWGGPARSLSRKGAHDEGKADGVGLSYRETEPGCSEPLSGPHGPHPCPIRPAFSQALLHWPQRLVYSFKSRDKDQIVPDLPSAGTHDTPAPNLREAGEECEEGFEATGNGEPCGFQRKSVSYRKWYLSS